MKINCEVIGVETRGDQLRVVLQGTAVGDADWRPFGTFQIDVAPSKPNCRAYYIGRKVKLDVTPA